MMDIDYSINLGRPSVKSLIAALQKIVDDNPEINFHKVGVSLPEGNSYWVVQLNQWCHNGKQRICVEID